MRVENDMIHVVDDDASMRDSLCWMLQASGLKAQAHPAPEGFLAHHDREEPSCLILDLEMPGTNGLSFLQDLRKQGNLVPVIVFTGTGDVRKAIESMKLGAMDFFEKPADHTLLIDAVRRALENDKSRLSDQSRLGDIVSRFNDLTERERELVPLICEGMSNKEIAIKLNISSNTVKNHRVRLIKKVKAANTADFVRCAMLSNLFNQPKPGADR
jgi:two-component system response regulator FixJ